MNPAEAPTPVAATALPTPPVEPGHSRPTKLVVLLYVHAFISVAIFALIVAVVLIALSQI